MRIILTTAAAVLAVYLAFVALNTYLYHEKQEAGAPLLVQWGM